MQLNLEDHRLIATNVHEIKQRLYDIYRIAVQSEKLPRRSRAATTLHHLTRTADQLRVLLDDELSRGFPELAQSCYYAIRFPRQGSDQHRHFGQSGTSPTGASEVAK